jgi:hypothetical protein
MISNEIVIAGIGAATTIITAYLAYLTRKVEQVHKVVNSAATALALQVTKDKAIALKLSEDEAAVVARRVVEEKKVLIQKNKE